MQTIIPHIANQLAHVFNKSLQTGIVPDKLKIAKVIPLYKNDNLEQFTNYRPISILPCFSKIIERIMYNMLYSFLTKHNIISEKQYGFRKKYATYMALIDLVDKISSNFDEKKYTVGVFLDLSKAFDTIDHTILINKLQCYGVRGSACNWFVSYLQNRKQYVVYNKTESDYKEMSCGVPQGSILGPLLFILYINDIEHVSDIIKPIHFADDASLFHSHTCFNTLIQEVNIQLHKFSTWFNTNKLSLNTTYCVTLTVLHFIMGTLSCNTHKKITIITEKNHSNNHIISLHCTHKSTIRYDKTFKIRRSVQIPIRHIYA